MIIGYGDVASAIIDSDDKIFFASGVSNSQETRESEFQVEKDLLASIPKDFAHIVYFGSLAIFYNDNRYAQHKREMEELVKQYKNYTIIRLGNITWGSNPNTIINSMKKKFENGEKLEIRDEYRFIVNKDEFQYWINLIPSWNCEMNLTGRWMKIKDIVKEYVL